KNLYDGTKSLNTTGFVEKVDLDRVTVAYNNLLAEREKTQRLLGLSVALLKYQIGMAQSATLTLSDNLEGISFQPENLSTEPSYANRIEYSLAETQKRAAFLQLKNDKLSFLPSAVLYLNAGASAMRMKFDVFDPSEKWYPFTILGGTVNVPIFSGLQKNYRIQQSKIALKKADNDLKYAQQSIELEQTNTRIALQNATQTLDIQKKNIEVAEEVYKATKLKYENGVGLNYEVISAETALKEAQTNYFGALFDALVAKVDYQKSIGVLIK
ncbi:MAG: TolC family protein, partial [Bacteroidia bacterium]|nr:TolC family protein [Bacteroidia bacterium]